MSKFIGQDILIYDLECSSSGDPDPETDILKIFGAYSYKTDKYYVIPYTDRKFIEKIIDNHKFFVGFNNKDYDNPILKRFDYKLNNKIIIDLQQIIKNRAGAMKTNKGMLGNVLMKFSLDYITRFLDLVDDDTAKDDIDYAIFDKPNWSAEDVQKIKYYTERDLEITKKLYEWLEDYFWSFRDFIPEEEVQNKTYITDSMAKFGYKAICHAMNWEPEYNFDAYDEEDNDKIGGGYCAYPAGEKFAADIKIIDGKEHYKNPIIQLDYSSLYPSIMIQCNLYGRNKQEIGWHGDELFKIQGYYNDKELVGVSKLLRKLYYLRLRYKCKGILTDGTIFKYKDAHKYIGKEYYYASDDNKVLDLETHTLTAEIAKQMQNTKKDKREYTIKILINLQYGLLNQSYYKLVYDKTAADDCTNIGRSMVKYARKVFREHGYPLINSDTDSWYFIDVYNDKQRYIKLKDKVINDIKKRLPFPQPTFDADIDAEIKYIFFFKGKQEDKDSDIHMDEDDIINKPKGFMKKNYIYVTIDNELIIKNLGIKKKNISAISKKIFWDFMVPQIKNEGKIAFNKIEVQNKLIEYLQADMSLAYIRYNAKPLHRYKSESSIQAQISKRYGPGIHFMIPNKRGIGVCNSNKICSVKEFKERNFSIADIDMNRYWQELDYFIAKPKQYTLFEMQ